MPSTAQKQMTAEEFFVWQSRQDERYELVEGAPVKMMAGASKFHDRITSNIIITLGPQLRGGSCWVATPDTATRTKINSLRRPDVTVTRTAPLLDSYGASDPKLIVEVLSPSNKGLTWQRKLDEYFRLKGLANLLLIDSEKVAATLYTRTAAEWGPTDADDLEQVFDMPAIGCRLAMRAVYEGLKFEET